MTLIDLGSRVHDDPRQLVRLDIVMKVDQAAYVAKHGTDYEDPHRLATGVGMSVVAAIGDQLGRGDELHHHSSIFSAVDAEPRAMYYDSDTEIPFTIKKTEQTIVVSLGGGTVYRVDDRAERMWSLGNLAKIERAVLTARLRAIADLLEEDQRAADE